MNREPRNASALILLAFLQACATQTPAPEMAQESAEDFAPTWSTVADSADVRGGWIDEFGDEVLSALVLEAQEHNRELRGLAAEVEQARALARQAGAALRPSAGLDATSGRQSAEGFTANVLTAALQVTWELDLWGRLRSERSASQANFEAFDADFRFARHSLAASVARAYFVAIDAQLQNEIVGESESNLRRITQIVELQVNEGVANRQDFAVSRSDLAAVRSQLAVAEGASRDALRALEILLGRYPGAELSIREQLPHVPAPPIAGVPSDLLERRPDLIAAERRVAAAFQQLNAAKTARLPSISLTSSIGGAASGLDALLDSSNRSWSGGAELLAPIFQGGALEAQVEQANAEQQAAIANYGQAALDAFGDVESALDAGIVLARQEAQLREALSSANEAFRIAKFRFDEGDLDLLDLLLVEQRVFERRVDLVANQRALLEQRVSLYLALGGSWE